MMVGLVVGITGIAVITVAVAITVAGFTVVAIKQLNINDAKPLISGLVESARY